VQTPLEFGHKVFLAESAQGLITQYEVLEGNPDDERHVEPSLKSLTYELLLHERDRAIDTVLEMALIFSRTPVTQFTVEVAVKEHVRKSTSHVESSVLCLAAMAGM
jgi:hypothetical protein